jgi:hypothetical protein
MVVDIRSGVVLWWRRRRTGGSDVTKTPRKPKFRVYIGFIALDMILDYYIWRPRRCEFLRGNVIQILTKVGRANCQFSYARGIAF